MRDDVRSILGVLIALVAGTLVWYALWSWIVG
jgi:hypothetical protein